MGDDSAPSTGGRPPWGVLAICVAGLVGVAWVTMVATRTGPRVDEVKVARLASAGRFEAAEAALVDHLKRSPRDARAHYLLAQLLTDRTDVPSDSFDPGMAGRALEHAERAATLDPQGEVARPAKVWLYRGKALYQLRRWEAAERAWRAALRADPRVPEAGWSLLGLYYLEGRRDEARRLALRLYTVEPEPRDRAQLLLELVRQDAVPVSAESMVPQFEAAVAAEPEAVWAAIGLGQSLIRSSDLERGLRVLQELVERRPDSADGWGGLLTGLEMAARPEEIPATLARVPQALRDRRELAGGRALAAQVEGRWADGARELTSVVENDPTDFGSLVRLERALRFTGDAAGAEECERRVALYRTARQGLLALYEEANAATGLGVRPHLELCARLAEAREAMGRADEAACWGVIGRGVQR